MRAHAAHPALLALPLALGTPLMLVACAETDEPKIEELEPDEATRYELQDRLGSASVILDQQGAVVTHTGLEPYGETWAEDKPAGESGAVYRFTDKELDAGVGTIYIGMRHYLPELGRWASPDPKFCWEDPAAVVSDPREGNAYRYGANSPMMQVDPDGRDSRIGGAEFHVTLMFRKYSWNWGWAEDHKGVNSEVITRGRGVAIVPFSAGVTPKYTYVKNKNGNEDLKGYSESMGGGATVGKFAAGIARESSESSNGWSVEVMGKSTPGAFDGSFSRNETTVVDLFDRTTAEERSVGHKAAQAIDNATAGGETEDPMMSMPESCLCSEPG